MVILDVGGFSLASMGDHARQQVDERVARKASVTGNFLIGVTIDLLFPPAKQCTSMAEKGLILVRGSEHRKTERIERTGYRHFTHLHQ